MTSSSNCNTPLFDQGLYDAVNSSNQKLMNIANEMYNYAIKLDNTSTQVEKQGDTVKNELVQQIKSLNEEREKMIKLKGQVDIYTLDGDMQDDKINVNMEKARYIGMGLAALVLGGITIHVMTKK